MFCDLKAGVILVAEDNPDEAMLLQRAFKKAGLEIRVHICGDGNEATDYLRGENAFKDRLKFPFPNMVITDLKMPRCDGFQILQWLQAHPECNLIPKIVLSASNQPVDVIKAYQLGANCYFTKPSSMKDLTNLVRLLNEFWSTAEIPPLPPNC